MDDPFIGTWKLNPGSSQFDAESSAHRSGHALATRGGRRLPHGGGGTQRERRARFRAAAEARARRETLSGSRLSRVEHHDITPCSRRRSAPR